MMSTIRKDKGKQIFLKGTAFKSYALFQNSNLDHRQSMQDQSFLQDTYLQNCPKSALFGVFDGHGGHQVSQFLVKNMPIIIKDNYKNKKKRGKQLFEQSFQQADKRIQTMDVQSGSTGTVGLLTLQQQKRVLYIAYVGDSSAYLFDDYSFQKLTNQHRCDNKQQATRIKKGGGKILMNRLGGLLAITRAFGDFGLKKGAGLISKPQIKKIQIRLTSKYIIVASDGLWDYVNIKNVQKIIKQEQESDNIARKLIKTALNSGSMDNISVIVIRL